MFEDMFCGRCGSRSIGRAVAPGRTRSLSACEAHIEARRTEQWQPRPPPDKMFPEDVAPFACQLQECGKTRNLEEGRRLHEIIVKKGHADKMFIANHIVNMYGKCGSPQDAQRTFDGMRLRNIVSWNAMISVYAQNGCNDKAFQMFFKMQLVGVRPSSITFTSVLNACTGPETLPTGKIIHAVAVESGLELNPVVGTALLNMYSKSASVDDARNMFNRLEERDVIAWTNMITVYTQCGHGREAFETFQRMNLEGLKPNVVTFVGVVHACMILARLAEGRVIHGWITESGFDGDVVLGTALVNMYGKCGSVVEAQRIFDRMGEKDVVLWSAILEAYAQHGHPETALKIFKKMQQEGVKPNRVTFVGVLVACSHGGLVDEGRFHFASLVRDHEIKATEQHYYCMLDVLGRAGELEEAEEFIGKMPFKPESIAWTTLLSACRNHGDVARGKRAAEKVFEFEPHYPSGYVALAHLYTDAGMFDEAAAVRRVMESKCGKKERGWSSIVIRSKVHEFCARSQWHPRSKEIYAELDVLHARIEEVGYVPDMKPVVADGGVDRRFHSERLAIAFGLLSTAVKSPLHIIKNLRVCNDCHKFTKFISRIVEREIVVRDASRFHLFKDGVCSCGDYW